MYRTLTLTVVACLLATSLSAALAEDYYPMKEGNSWTYSLPTGGDMTMKVTGFEEVKGVKCARVEGEMAGQGKVSSWIATDADGIRMYKFKSPQAEIEFGKPPLQIKLPFKQGDKWQSSLPLQQPVDAAMESAGRETVKVPAGTFECIRINTVVTVGENKLTTSTWYADGVGQVQVTMSAGDQQATMQLTKTNVEPGARPAVINTDTPRPAVTPGAARFCPACGAKVPADAAFCPACGAKMPAAAPAAPAMVRPTACPKCGAALSADAKFCPGCGWKVELISAGTAPSPTPSQPTGVGVKQATPKELVETHLLATDRVDFDTLVRISAPEYREAAKLLSTMLAKTGQMHDKFVQLADAMEKPLGKESADAARTQAKAMSPENFKEAITKENKGVYQDGKIDWDKITIDDKGDTATATWAGQKHPAKMVKVDGKWYLIPGDEFGKTPEEAKAKILKMIDSFDKGMAKLDDVIAQLNGGKMTAQDFGAAMQEFSKLMQD